MAETLRNDGLWHIILAEKDLIKQGGLSPKDFEQDLGCFRYKERRIIMSHVYNKHLVVSMEGQEDANLKLLIDGFSKVVEYKPFCKYSLKVKPNDGGEIPQIPTYEWDKTNPDQRFEELSKKSNVSELVKL